MNTKGRVTIDRLSIRLSRASPAEARGLARSIARELGHALGSGSTSRDRLAVPVSQRRAGETGGLFARRIGRTAALTIGGKGGRGRGG